MMERLEKQMEFIPVSYTHLIVILDTAGVSSMYANDGGVIVAV